MGERFFKIHNFVSRRRPYFKPVWVKVTISFEKLTNEPYKFEEKILMLFEKLLKSKNVQLVTFIVKDYVTCEFKWNDL